MTMKVKNYFTFVVIQMIFFGCVISQGQFGSFIFTREVDIILLFQSLGQGLSLDLVTVFPSRHSKVCHKLYGHSRGMHNVFLIQSLAK